MKLSNLFMIALLAGTLGVFGCSDDPPSNGNGGSGGDGAAGTGGSGTAGTGGSGTAGTGGSGTAGTGGSGTAGTGGTGTGGTGGGAADPCTGNNCDLTEPKLACEAAVAFCKSADCCGDGVDPTDGECDAFGEALCTIDFGGAGGTGGTGGAGGAGGSDGPTAEEVCDECDSPNVDRIAACEKAYDDCIAADPSGTPDNVQEKCAVFALSRCGV